MSFKIHRNLNDRTPDSSEGWVLTPKGEKSYRVEEVLLLVHTVKISNATLDRIRTPRGQKTKSGASGIGRRTVGAWLVGDLVSSTETTSSLTGSTIHFNPHVNDSFMIQINGKYHKFTPSEVGEVLHFKKCGSVEVVA